ncbi:MAG: hypothetical protein ACREM2_11975, partial [Vulcanimicrobiaceae bacterium]
MGGIQFVWGAVLAVSLQARTIALVGSAHAVVAYAALAAGGALVATVVQFLAGIAADRERRRRGDRLRAYAVGTA